MNIIQSILVLVIFVSSVTYAKPYNFRRFFDELLEESRAAAQQTTSCNWITYDYDRTKQYFDAKSYACQNTITSDPCVLPLSNATILCNSDPKCIGFATTTNGNWHAAFDRKNEVSVSLFATYGTTNSIGSEWFVFPKTCWNFH